MPVVLITGASGGSGQIVITLSAMVKTPNISGQVFSLDTELCNRREM